MPQLSTLESKYETLVEFNEVQYELPFLGKEPIHGPLFTQLSLNINSVTPLPIFITDLIAEYEWINPTAEDLAYLKLWFKHQKCSYSFINKISNSLLILLTLSFALEVTLISWGERAGRPAEFLGSGATIFLAGFMGVAYYINKKFNNNTIYEKINEVTLEESTQLAREYLKNTQNSYFMLLYLWALMNGILYLIASIMATETDVPNAGVPKALVASSSASLALVGLGLAKISKKCIANRHDKDTLALEHPNYSELSHGLTFFVKDCSLYFNLQHPDPLGLRLR